MTEPAPCPICGKPSNPDYRPFCSRRCADVDLARWLKGTYRVPAPDDDPDLPESDPEYPLDRGEGPD